jgi:hypothetical protein
MENTPTNFVHDVLQISCMVVHFKMIIISLVLEHDLQLLTSSKPTTIEETAQVFTSVVGSGSI